MAMVKITKTSLGFNYGEIHEFQDDDPILAKLIRKRLAIRLVDPKITKESDD